MSTVIPDSLNMAAVNSPKPLTRYLIISPVRDEEKYLQFTFESVSAQTVRPLAWVIVDDGSSDNTGQIADGFAAQHPWIQVVHRGNRGFRKAGGGVIEAFYDGFHAAREKDWDFVVKLDGDLTLPNDYFEKCFAYFERDPQLGIAGGALYHNFDGRMELEVVPKFHVRGATKIYRRACWEAIGGLHKVTGWDTIDETKANMLGWRTQTLKDVHLLHHRFTGTAESTWKGMVKNGVSDYIAGYHPLFMLVKCLSRVRRRPHVMGPLGLFWGYWKGHLTRAPRVDDAELIRYLRQQQMRRLMGMETIWK